MQELQLNTEQTGEGPDVVLLHGLTATSHYATMGSNLLQRGGYRVTVYDARGHGQSPAPDSPDEYGYEVLARDLAAVMDGLGVKQAIIGGSSMGSHTAVAFALAHPERVRGLLLTTPAYLPGHESDESLLRRWDRLSAGLREGGVEGFMSAEDFSTLSPRWLELVQTATRQRLQRHADLNAVADALAAVPRSPVFSDLSELNQITCPVSIIGSLDETDPSHPLAVAKQWQEAIPGAELVVEEAGKAPIAWQGGQISRVALGLAERANLK